MEKEEYGILVKECNIIMQGGVEYPLFNYVSGIDKFDKFLNGKNFSETDYKTSIAWFEFAVVFYIYNSKEQVSQAFSRSEFVDIVEHKDQKIEILNINKFTKSLKHGRVGGGLVGGVVFKVAGLVADGLNEKMIAKSSKTVDGSIFEFKFNSVNNGQYEIKVSCEKQNLIYTWSFLVNKHFLKPQEPSSSSACYIATICYKDSMSAEVVKFREFRDEILRYSYFGKKFINFYYNYAENLSKKLAKQNSINTLIRIFVLNPIYLCVKLFLKLRKR